MKTFEELKAQHKISIETIKVSSTDIIEDSILIALRHDEEYLDLDVRPIPPHGMVFNDHFLRIDENLVNLVSLLIENGYKLNLKGGSIVRILLRPPPL